jgi:putative protease
VSTLIKIGFRFWQIGHISQLTFFYTAWPHKKSGSQKGRKEIEIGGDFTLNILNTLALNYLNEIGVKWAQFSVESDKMSLMQMNRNKKGIKAGLTVYGRPPLFTTRITPDFFRYGQTFVSPRGEKFELQKRAGQVIALPEKPFSLLSVLSEQPLADLDYVVLDITGRHHGVRDLAYIFDQLQGKGKSKFPSMFNYSGVLQ